MSVQLSVNHYHSASLSVEEQMVLVVLVELVKVQLSKNARYEADLCAMSSVGLNDAYPS